MPKSSNKPRVLGRDVGGGGIAETKGGSIVSSGGKKKARGGMRKRGG